jgi:SAM-dependent methyltransferase
MPGQTVPRQFDEISPVYDTTRDPLDDATLETIVGCLRSHDVASVLEVGIGTGRVALPLAQRGITVTGIDASHGMLAHARAKGAERLVLGSAYALPFRPGSFDAALFVHVLHLLDEPIGALREACRVTRRGAVALVRPGRDGPRDRLPGSEEDPRRIFFECLRKEGYAMPVRTGGPRVREAQILKDLPPDRLEVVSDREVTVPVARRIDMFELRASRQVLDVPAEALHRAAAEARARVGDRTVTFRRVEALATWTRIPVASASA